MRDAIAGQCRSLHLRDNLPVCCTGDPRPVIVIVVVITAELHIQIVAHTQHELLLSRLECGLAQEGASGAAEGISTGTAATASRLRELLVRRLGSAYGLRC